MRLKEITPPQQRLLRELSRRISNRLEMEFSDLPGTDGRDIGVKLLERGREVLMTVPGGLLVRATGDPVAREAVRVRIKARRDRMLFCPPPTPLPRRIAAAPDPASGRFGYGRRPGAARGRR